MKFSIVTLSYNQEKFIKECIESVINQKDVNIEYIVVDPGSKDSSRKIINSYKKIKKVYKKDNGPSEGLNNGFSIATGDYFGFLNADDYLLPDAIKKIEEEIKKSGANFISGKGVQLQNKNYKTILPTKLTLEKMIYRVSKIFQPSTFFSRELYHLTNGFNPNNKTCWDYELYVDMLKVGAKHHLLNENLAVFRLYENSITGSERFKNEYQKDLSRIFKENKNRNYNFLDKTLTFLLRSFNMFPK